MIAAAAVNASGDDGLISNSSDETKRLPPIAAGIAERQAGADQDQRLFQHHPSYRAAVRAERHPQPQLRRPAAHRVGEQPVQTDRREQQRHAAEQGCELGEQPLPPQREIDLFALRAQVRDRQLGIDRAYGGADLLGDGRSARAVVRTTNIEPEVGAGGSSRRRSAAPAGATSCTSRRCSRRQFRSAGLFAPSPSCIRLPTASMVPNSCFASDSLTIATIGVVLSIRWL